jgi:hypothetical protein
MLHDGQINILQNSKRFNTVRCGRRFGKTTLGLAVAWYGCPKAPGSLRTGLDVGWFAPSYKLLDEAWRSSLGFLKPYIKRKDTQQRRIELHTGATLDFWTLEDEDAGRSRHYGIAIVDEGGMARKLKNNWQLAIRQTLTDHRGSGWFLSTPKGSNYFKELCDKADLDPTNWASFHAPTSANPYIPADEIEAARLELPERVFAQEYLAEFLEDSGGVFRRVNAAIDHSLPVDPATARDLNDGRAYLISVDWARHEDFTVFIVIDAKTNSIVCADRINHTDYASQLMRLRSLHSRFPKAPIIAERNNMGESLIEQLWKPGPNGEPPLPVIAFDTTPASKWMMVQALQIAFEDGTIRIPCIPWLYNELIAFEQTKSPTGLKFSAPSGQHDDGVIALAIGWANLDHAKPKKLGAKATNL